MKYLNSKLYNKIQPWRVREDSMMPWAYRTANPEGRPLHNDWFIGKKVKRIDTAYRLPLPFKQLTGKSEKKWVLWDVSYPTAIGTPIEYREYFTTLGRFFLPHALIDCAGPGRATFAAFIDGEWIECFEQYHDVWFGKRLSYYRGLKQDTTVSPPKTLNGPVQSDLMCWYPELAVSWVKEI